MAFTIHGPQFSTYVRSVRMALAEKATAYETVEVDTLKGEHKEAAHLARNPFGVVPAFAHDDFVLYETQAILRYVDRVVPMPWLIPADAKQEARMNQIMGIVDSFAYDAMIVRIVIQRMIVPMMGGTADEAMIAGALPRTETCLAEIERLMGDQRFLAADHPSLADCMVVPVLHYLLMTPEGEKAMAPHGKLRRWWDAIQARPSVADTVPKLG